MFKLFRRRPPVEAAEAAVSLWDRFLPKPADILTWLTVFFTSGVGMTYLASATDWLAAWGPVAWGAIGIGSGGAMLLLVALAARLRRGREPALEARIAALESKPAPPPAAAAISSTSGEAGKLGVEPAGPRAAAADAAVPGLERRLGAVERQLQAAREVVVDVNKAIGRLTDSAGNIGPALKAALADTETTLRAEIGAATRDIREGDAARFEAIRKAVDHALDQAKQRQDEFEIRATAQIAASNHDVLDRLERSGNHLHEQITDLNKALAAQLKAVAAAAESRTRDVFDAFRETYVPRFEELEGRLGDLASQIGGLREDMDRELLVRDVDAVLRELAEPITQLHRKVLRAEAEAYRDARAWRFDLSQLQSKLERFWDIVNTWESTLPQPSLPLRRELLDVSRNDYAAVHEKPGPAVPDDFADQQLWRWVHVVARRHIEQSEKALARIRKEARAI